MQKSNGLESGLGPQTSLSPNPGSRSCQLLQLRVRGVTSLGLGFPTGAKENIAKLGVVARVLSRGLSFAPGRDFLARRTPHSGGRGCPHFYRLQRRRILMKWGYLWPLFKLHTVGR